MPKQSFRNQKGGQRKKTLSEFKNYLNINSGNDPIELIATYLATREGMKKKLERSEFNLDGKLKILVNSLKKQHDLAAPHEKRRWLSLVSKLLTMEELQKLGWKINSHTFRTARKHCDKCGPGAPIPKPKIPLQKQRKLELQTLVHQFFYLDEISREAPNNYTKVNQVSLNFLEINYHR
jgi:hypothetical protein